MKISYIASKCWCGESKTHLFFGGFWYANKTKIPIKLGKCINCGTVRTLGLESNLKVDYNETIIYNNIGYRHKMSLKTINSNICQGNLLEIGCSSGLILNEIQKSRNDIKLIGIDLNKVSLENSINKNLDLRYGNIESIDNKFNNVIALHVLEHIPDLESFFMNLLKITTINSIIYLSVPNINSFNYKRNKEKWGALNPLQHTWHFSKKTFSKVVQHYLPNSRIRVLKSSWIWKPKLIGILGNNLIEADQIEIVVEL